ncbi:MAG: hydroxyacylglutathione hydrolase [Actinomycetota bacterium]|nr:hydroxyacylglutathione hydrolase [Actinomycetota bacterium]
MFVTGFPAAAFDTNCYVLAAAPGEECVVVDPGIEVMGQLSEVLARYRLRPAAVLLTHGHVDHVWSVTPVCGAHGVGAYIHPDDAYRLADPLASLDPALVAMLEQQFGPKAAWSEPDDVSSLVDGQELALAGLRLQVAHAPGHTEGSVIFTVPGPPDGTEGSATALTGDVLFAGSVGRTDLPGGDPEAMLRTLREKVLTLADDVVVLPGHGPSTTVARERATNPYLAQAARGV